MDIKDMELRSRSKLRGVTQTKNTAPQKILLFPREKCQASQGSELRRVLNTI